MPVNKKHPVGPCKSTVHLEEHSKALKAGEKAYREGKSIKDCPHKWRRVVGGSPLFYSFLTGFRAAQVAQVPQETRA